MRTIIEIFNQKKYWLEEFFEKNYEESFREFSETYEDTFAQAVKGADSPEALAESVVAALDEIVQEARFWKRSAYRQDIRMLLTTYGFPLLLASGDEQMTSFCHLLCDTWNEKHDGDPMTAVDRDTILGGFRDTIFGFRVEGLLSKEKSKKDLR